MDGECTEEEVVSHWAEAVVLQECHEEAETDEDHHVHVLEHGILPIEVFTGETRVPRARFSRVWAIFHLRQRLSNVLFIQNFRITKSWNRRLGSSRKVVLSKWKLKKSFEKCEFFSSFFFSAVHLKILETHKLNISQKLCKSNAHIFSDFQKLNWHAMVNLAATINKTGTSKVGAISKAQNSCFLTSASSLLKRNIVRIQCQMFGYILKRSSMSRLRSKENKKHYLSHKQESCKLPFMRSNFGFSSTVTRRLLGFKVENIKPNYIANFAAQTALKIDFI